MTARALEGIEAEIVARKPDVVVVFGDTNSTLAGGLAAVKLGVPSAHVEAGLRSFDRSMPEEINRIVVDHTCDVLFAPNEAARANLEREGLGDRTEVVGDIMVDALFAARGRAPAARDVLKRLGVPIGPYVLMTVHRAANTDDPSRMRAILEGVVEAGTVVFAVHPRARVAMREHGIDLPPNVHGVEPLAYLDTVALTGDAEALVTDSGGLQKEAYLLETPCITLRENTEWGETVELGWNVLVGGDTTAIRGALTAAPRGTSHPAIYGDGQTAGRIVRSLERLFA